MTRAARAAALAVPFVLLLGCGGTQVELPDSAPSSGAPSGSAPSASASFTRLAITSTDDVPYDGGLADWREQVPGVQELRIPSTADGTAQRALLVPGPREPSPLLVVLHSWSNDYEQENGIPYAQFAQAQGWALVHPDFRGVNERPQSTGSDLAVQDVLDAVDEASRRTPVDPERVYLVGFSGGGHMSLLMAGRHPDRFAGVVSWVGIHDLTRWYVYNRDEQPDAAYARQLRDSCGGDPSQPGAARDACLQRSPVTHLDAAREAGVPVYLAAGLSDQVVPPDHTLDAFNQLAPSAAVPAADVEQVRVGRLPDALRGQVQGEAFFGEGDPAVLFSRSAGPVTTVLFEGGHAMLFNPGLGWLVDRDSRS